MMDSSGSGRLALAALAAALLFVVPQADAVEVEGLYTVDVALEAGAGGRERAYEDALAEVLVRITGQESARTDEDMLGLFPTPARYVMQYARGDQDRLIVTLDGDAISQLLRRAGHPVWENDRPLTLLWLAVEWAPGERELVGAAEPGRRVFGRQEERRAQVREQIANAAARRGLPVLLPQLDAEDRNAVTVRDVWGGFDQALLAASRRYETASVLVGKIRSDNPTRNQWTYYFGNRELSWTGPADRVIGQLADALAEQFAVSGADRPELLSLTISGIDTVQAFGEISRLLAGISIVERARIDRVAGPEIRYRVEVRGGAERLANALAFSGMLERQSAISGADFSMPVSADPQTGEPTRRPNSGPNGRPNSLPDNRPNNRQDGRQLRFRYRSAQPGDDSLPFDATDPATRGNTASTPGT